MRHMGGQAEVGQQVSEPAPPIGGFESHSRRRSRQVTNDLGEFLWTRPNSSIPEHFAVGLNCGHLRHLAVQVDADVNHVWASFLAVLRVARLSSRLTPGAEAPLLHDINWCALATVDGDWDQALVQPFTRVLTPARAARSEPPATLP